jgi:DNA-binding beta-propeller fold protein YncE
MLGYRVFTSQNVLILKPKLLLGFGLLWLMMLACNPPKDPKPTPTPTPVQAVGFPAEVGAIFTAKCAACHNDQVRFSGLHLANYDSLRRGGLLGAVVVPYSRDWSHLLWHLNTFGTDFGFSTRPLMPSRLNGNVYEFDSANAITEDEYFALRNWIQDGAPNAQGTPMWQHRETTSSGKLFFLCQGSDLLGVKDLATNQVIRYIRVGQGQSGSNLASPHFVYPSPDGQFVYVTLINGGLLEKYRTDNYQFVGRVSLGEEPAHVKLSADGRRAIVSHWATGSNRVLTLVDTEAMTVLDQVTGSVLTPKAHGLLLSPDFRQVLVTANGGNHLTRYLIRADGNGFDFGDIPDQFSLIVNNEFSFNTPVLRPYDLVYSPDRSKIYVTCAADAAGDRIQSRVVVLNAQTLEVIAQIKHNPSNVRGSLGQVPRLLVAHGDYLYVACRNTDSFLDQGPRLGSVSVIDMRTDQFVENIWRLGHQPHGLAIDPARGLLHVSLENGQGVDPPHHPIEGSNQIPGQLSTVDLATRQVLRNLQTEVGAVPSGCVLIP